MRFNDPMMMLIHDVLTSKNQKIVTLSNDNVTISINFLDKKIKISKEIIVNRIMRLFKSITTNTKQIFKSASISYSDMSINILTK